VKNKERERSGTRERSGEQFLLFPSQPKVCSSSFLHFRSVFFLHPPSFFFLYSPSLLFLCPPSYFSTGIIISPLVEQKKYWVYPLQQSLGIHCCLWKGGIFVSVFGEYLINCGFFFVTVLFKSGSGRSGVENNHLERNLQFVITFFFMSPTTQHVFYHILF